MSRGEFPERVTDPASVRLLLHERSRKVLGCFLLAEQSVSGAARQTGLDIRAVHRDVRALVAAGLLRAERREARAGRAIEHYRASAGAYFVPQSLHASADQAEQLEHLLGPIDRLLGAALGREFERAIAASGRREWGTRLFMTPDGIETDQCFYDAELRGVLTGWQGPPTLAFTGAAVARLTDQEAQAIQADFVQLIVRLQALGEVNQARGQGRPFAVRLVQTPVSQDEHQLLKAMR